VSTNSTTGALKKEQFLHCCAPRFYRGVSTNSTTGATERTSKKNPACSGILSGRPGSNRPPRPWQGRALPNELLPLLKELDGKSKEDKLKHKRFIQKNLCFKDFFFYLVYLGSYNVLEGTSTLGFPL
jgi:hypothetical protein